MNAPLAENKVTNVSPLRRVMKSNDTFFLYIEINEQRISEILYTVISSITRFLGYVIRVM